MAAAADRFAVRVEQDDFQPAQAVAMQQMSDSQPQMLDAESRRHLSDEAARVGVSELYRHLALAL